MRPAEVTSVLVQRGRIVRSIVHNIGTGRHDSLFNAYADAGIFNRQHPHLAIPRPRTVLGPAGVLVRECSRCEGEGAEMGIKCLECDGSGFAGIRGVGAAAVKAYR